MIPFNLSNFIFVNFTVFIGVMSVLINLAESFLPNTIRQFFRYGKMSHKGEQCRLTALTEIPKAWFKHFYVFGLIWSTVIMLLASRVYFWNLSPPEPVLRFLDLVSGSSPRSVEVTSTVCLVAVALLTIQCWRRFFETHFVQIFSRHSKINLAHYLVGYFHYYAAFVGLLANSEGFVRGAYAQGPKLSDINTLQMAAIVLFLYSWLQQYRSNMILVNLRRNKSGKVVTEQHLMPEDGWFEYVSSPHMLFEVLMYFALLILMPNCTTVRYCFIWVLMNQTETSWLTHKWYQDTFGSKYPKRRKAIFPFVL